MPGPAKHRLIKGLAAFVGWGLPVLAGAAPLTDGQLSAWLKKQPKLERKLARELKSKSRNDRIIYKTISGLRTNGSQPDLDLHSARMFFRAGNSERAVQKLDEIRPIARCASIYVHGDPLWRARARELGKVLDPQSAAKKFEADGIADGLGRAIAPVQRTGEQNTCRGARREIVGEICVHCGSKRDRAQNLPGGTQRAADTPAALAAASFFGEHAPKSSRSGGIGKVW